MWPRPSRAQDRTFWQDQLHCRLRKQQSSFVRSGRGSRRQTEVVGLSLLRLRRLLLRFGHLCRCHLIAHAFAMPNSQLWLSLLPSKLINERLNLPISSFCIWLGLSSSENVEALSAWSNILLPSIYYWSSRSFWSCLNWPSAGSGVVFRLTGDNCSFVYSSASLNCCRCGSLLIALPDPGIPDCILERPSLCCCKFFCDYGAPNILGDLCRAKIESLVSLGAISVRTCSFVLTGLFVDVVGTPRSVSCFMRSFSSLALRCLSSCLLNVSYYLSDYYCFLNEVGILLLIFGAKVHSSPYFSNS